MQVVRHHTPQAFHDATHDFLMESELMNNVIIGLLSRMIHQAESFGETFLAHVENVSGDVVAATMIAGQGVILSNIVDKAAIPALVEAYADRVESLADVVGEQDDSSQFATLWQEKRQVSYHIMLEYGYYQLTEVIPPENVSGNIRKATMDDLELLVDWLVAFSHDTGVELEYTREDALKNVLRKLEKPILGGIRIWMDGGQPVSMAAATRELPNGGNISLVYTPEDLRGCGYASAVTASVSQEILDIGKSFCCLSTDMANPTSNKIYQAIGYQFVGNHRRIKFESTS